MPYMLISVAVEHLLLPKNLILTMILWSSTDYLYKLQIKLMPSKKLKAFIHTLNKINGTKITIYNLNLS
jgi:hypothetical protein